MSNLSANESNVDLLRFFKALADETRLKMAALLASKPRSGEQLAELLSIKAATVSHHLSKLADAELVTSTSEGHKKFYTLRLDAVRATAQQLQAKDPGLLVPAGGDISPNSTRTAFSTTSTTAGCSRIFSTATGRYGSFRCSGRSLGPCSSTSSKTSNPAASTPRNRSTLY